MSEPEQIGQLHSMYIEKTSQLNILVLPLSYTSVIQ